MGSLLWWQRNRDEQSDWCDPDPRWICGGGGMWWSSSVGLVAHWRSCAWMGHSRKRPWPVQCTHGMPPFFPMVVWPLLIKPTIVFKSFEPNHSCLLSFFFSSVFFFCCPFFFFFFVFCFRSTCFSSYFFPRSFHCSIMSSLDG